MPKAIKGDYNISTDLRTLNQDEMKNYIFIDKIGVFELYNRINTEIKLINNCDYILGYYALNNRFKKVAKIYFNKIDNYYEVDTIYVSKDFRGSGIASKLYTYFAKNLNYSILSSDMQRFGARRLWSKLSKNPNLTIDVIDFNNKEILENNIIINHGTKDEEFDNRFWSYNNDKRYIRFILKSLNAKI